MRNIYTRNSTRVFVIMDARGNYYGPGGWHDDVYRARLFSPEDAKAMLKVFPDSAAISALLRDRNSGRQAA